MTDGRAARPSASGVVLWGDGDTLMIDECPPNADCMPMVSTVVVSADGLVLAVPIGAFVTVTVSSDPAWIWCSERVLVENLAAWGGLTNPVSTAVHIYLVGAEGQLKSLPGVPFNVAATRLFCPTNPGCGPVEPDTYLLHFGSNIGVPMGASEQFVASGRTFRGRNLRSFQTEWCDDYWNWAYWVVEQ